MMKPALSTVGCPEWTISQAVERAGQMGFEAVELRTFGDDSTRLACDPALTSSEKVRSLCAHRGIEVSSLATGLRFDEPVRQSMVSLVMRDAETCVRQAKRMVDLAERIGSPFVRVFPLEVAGMMSRGRAVSLIAERLRLVMSHAAKRRVRVVLENGGSFAQASDVMEIVERVDHVGLGVSYSAAAGHAAGDEMEQAVRECGRLGGRLWVARVRDMADGRDVELGCGDVPCEGLVKALVGSGFDGPVVYEWGRLWDGTLEPMDVIGGGACDRLFEWIREGSARDGAVRSVGAKHAMGA